MRRLRKVAFLLVLLAPLGAGWFALRSALGMEAARSSLDSLRRDVQEARKLGGLHTFGGASSRSGPVLLKSLVQEVAQKEGITVAFLSESERELGKGRREKQVLARVVQADHGKFVPFLARLEAEGGGAKVKEIHLKPSRTTTGVYEEAEIVLCHLSEREPGAKP